MQVPKTRKDGVMTTAGFIPHITNMAGFSMPVRVKSDPAKFKELPDPDRTNGNQYVYALPGGRTCLG